MPCPRLVPALLACLALHAASARADDGYDDAFAEARAWYDEVELARAAVRFRDAAARADNDDDRAAALLWAGVAAGQAGHLEEARADFDRALLLDAGLALPTAVSPKVEAVFAAAVAERPGVDTADTPTPVPPVAPAPEPAPTDKGPSAAPWVLTAGGGVALAVGAGVVVKALIDLSSASNPVTPQPAAQVLLDQANFELGVAAISGVVGAVALSTGLALLLAEDP